MMEDDKILDLYFARSERAITETQNKYGTFCGRIAGRILRSREDADECVNDTWFAAWNAIPPKRPTFFRAFLAKITRNLALNVLEKSEARKRGEGETESCLEELEEVLPSAANGLENTADEIALGRILNRFLAKQSESARKIFLQRYFYMLPVDEIAVGCHLTPSGVRMSLLRTRKALKDTLEEEGIQI